MKKHKTILFIAGIIFFAMYLNAQEYVPFPDSNAIWNQIYTSEQPVEAEIFQYGISGDTLINGKQYRKVYLLNDTVYPLVTGQYCGAIREEEKKIYVTGCDCVYPGAGQEEVILYDFSKAPGDTVYVGQNGWGPAGYLVVSSIDSILIAGSYRKTFHFAGYEHFWIEGIGSTRGLFSPVREQPTGFQQWKLICFNKDNEVEYLNPEFNTCFPPLSVSKNVKQDNLVKIIPHPVTGISTIEFENNTAAGYQYIDFYNIFGQLVHRINIQNKTRLNVSHVDFEPGLYLYRLSGSNMNGITGKIVFE